MPYPWCLKIAVITRLGSLGLLGVELSVRFSLRTEPMPISPLPVPQPMPLVCLPETGWEGLRSLWMSEYGGMGERVRGASMEMGRYMRAALGWFHSSVNIHTRFIPSATLYKSTCGLRYFPAV